MNIALVTCGKHKKKGLHQAHNLYTSERFQKNLKEASTICEKVFILSAKHRLLNPKDFVRNYDKALTDLSSDERVIWAQKTFQSLAKVASSKDAVHFFAEPIYYKDLQKLLDSAGYKTFIN